MIDWSQKKTVAAQKKAADDKENAKIVLELANIDLQSVRSLRAFVTGTATPADEQKLAELEAKAAAARARMKK